MNGAPDEYGSPTWTVQRDQPETVVQLAVIAHADVTPYRDQPIRLTVTAPALDEEDDTASVQLSPGELTRLLAAGHALLKSQTPAVEAPHSLTDRGFRIAELIAAERDRQNARWGEQNHSPETWYSILGEEFGEIGKAICERQAELGRGAELVASAHADEIRDELVQLAAVAVAMLESLERNQGVTL